MAFHSVFPSELKKKKSIYSIYSEGEPLFGSGIIPGSSSVTFGHRWSIYVDYLGSEPLEGFNFRLFHIFVAKKVISLT